MITLVKDKMEGFTAEYGGKLRHTCGTCFSNGPVEVGLTANINGDLVYTCAKCVAKQVAIKAQEEAELVVDFSRRWMKVEHVVGDFRSNLPVGGNRD